MLSFSIIWKIFITMNKGFSWKWVYYIWNSQENFILFSWFRYCEERPLLLSNVGMGANLCTYYQKTSSGDQTSGLLRNGNQTLGNVLLLEPADKSPFLGDIKAGYCLSSIETNMYKAPIFSHKVPSTDFLLVRSPKGKLSIRRIDKIAVVGQQVCHSYTSFCM